MLLSLFLFSPFFWFWPWQHGTLLAFFFFDAIFFIGRKIFSPRTPFFFFLSPFPSVSQVLFLSPSFDCFPPPPPPFLPSQAQTQSAFLFFLFSSPFQGFETAGGKRIFLPSFSPPFLGSQDELRINCPPPFFFFSFPLFSRRFCQWARCVFCLAFFLFPPFFFFLPDVEGERSLDPFLFFFPFLHRRDEKPFFFFFPFFWSKRERESLFRLSITRFSSFPFSLFPMCRFNPTKTASVFFPFSPRNHQHEVRESLPFPPLPFFPPPPSFFFRFRTLTLAKAFPHPPPSLPSPLRRPPEKKPPFLFFFFPPPICSLGVEHECSLFPSPLSSKEIVG